MSEENNNISKETNVDGIKGEEKKPLHNIHDSLEIKQQELSVNDTLSSSSISEQLPLEEKPSLPTIEIENQAENLAKEEEVFLDEKTMPSLQSIQIEDVPKVEPSKGNKRIFIVLILAAFLLIVGMIYFVFNNSKNLFLSAINKEYGNIVTQLKWTSLHPEYDDIKNTSVTEKGNFSFHIKLAPSLVDTNTTGLLDEINKLNGSFVTGIDYKNKKMAYNFIVNYDQNQMFNFNFYGSQKKMYIELKKLFNKYISIPIEEYETLFDDPNMAIDDGKYIIKTLKAAFLNSLESKDFKKTSTIIKIGTKEEKVNKIFYILDAKNGNKISKKMIENLEKDSKFIEILAKYTNESKEKIQSAMKKSKNENIMPHSDAQVTFIVYTKGILNHAVGYEIETKSESGMKNSIRYTKDGEKGYVHIYDNNKEVGNLVWVTKDENEREIKFTAGTVLLSVTVKKQENKMVIDYNMSEEISKAKLYGALVSNMNKENNGYTGNTNLTMNLDMQEISMMEVNLTSDYSGTIGQPISVPTDLENHIQLDQMTAVDFEGIVNNLMQDSVFGGFITNIQKYMNGSSNHLQ